MKKQLSNLGSLLNRAEQKQINGGGRKPEICNANGPIVICYFPTRCKLNSDGTYGCT